MTFETPDAIVIINVTENMKEKVFTAVLAFVLKNSCWSGESVMQRDTPQIEAPELVAGIVDNILKPKVHYEK